MTYNPNSPCAHGLEWFPTREVERPYSGVGDESYSWVLQDTPYGGTIALFFTYSKQDVFDAIDVIDVYDIDALEVPDIQINRQFYSGDAITYNVASGSAVYDSDTGITENTWVASTGTEFAAIVSDDPMTAGSYNGSTFSTPTWSNSVPITNRSFLGLLSSQFDVFPANASYAQWAFNVDNLDDDLTGRRVLELTVSCVCQRLVNPLVRNTEFDQPYRIRPALIIGGSTYLGQYRVMPNAPEVVSYTWKMNPATNREWTESDLAAFDSSDAVAWLMSRPAGLRIQNRTAGAIYQAWADVKHVQETRVARAYRPTRRQTEGWNLWLVEGISGGLWSKLDNRSYLFNASVAEQEAVDRRPSGRQDNLSMVALGKVPDDFPIIKEATPRFIEGVPFLIDEVGDYSPAFALYDESAFVWADSQIYAAQSANCTVPNYVHELDPVGQELYFDADDTPYNKIRFLVRSETDTTPSAPLNINIFDAGGSTIEKTAVPVDPVLDLPNPSVWTLIERDLEDDNGWTSGLQGHAVVFSVTEAGPVGWQVQMLSAVNPSSLWGDVTFGGESEKAVRLYPVDADSDLCVTLGIAPDAPGNLVATVDYVGVFGRVTLSWDAPEESACNTVDFYEIQREKLDGSWETVGYMPDDVTVFEDYEGRRNADNVYRVRAVAVSSFASEWTEPVTAVLEDDLCGYVFISNALPSLAVWYDDLGTRVYDPEETVNYYVFEGRDGSEAVRPLRDDLDRFDVSVFVAGYGAASPTVDASTLAEQGRRVFDPLLVLSGNKRDVETGQLVRLPYVAVLDNNGNRWFSSVETNLASYAASGGQYVLDTTVREVTTTAAPVDLRS